MSCFLSASDSHLPAREVFFQSTTPLQRTPARYRSHHQSDELRGQHALHERRASDRGRLAYRDCRRDASRGAGKLADDFLLTEKARTRSVPLHYFMIAPNRIPLYNEMINLSSLQEDNSVAHRFSYFILAAVLGGVFGQIAWADESPTSKSLWQTALPPLATADQPATMRKPWVLRDREIALDLPLLQILKDAGARPHPRITIELFDSANHELDITSTVSRSNDSAVIRGTFKPPSRGDFTFVASGNLLVGTMQLGDRLYKTEHIANGRLRLLEIDPQKLPPD